MNLWQRLAIVIGATVALGAIVLALLPVDGSVHVPRVPGQAAMAPRPPVTNPPDALLNECGERPTIDDDAYDAYYECFFRVVGRNQPGRPGRAEVPAIPAHDRSVDCGSVISEDRKRSCDDALDDRRTLAVAVGTGGIFVAVAGGLLLGSVGRARRDTDVTQEPEN